MMRVPAAKMVRGEICRICHFCRLACPSAAIRRCICSDGCGSGSPLSGFCRPARRLPPCLTEGRTDMHVPGCSRLMAFGTRQRYWHRSVCRGVLQQV
jgi:hypothetical protein